MSRLDVPPTPCMNGKATVAKQERSDSLSVSIEGVEGVNSEQRRRINGFWSRATRLLQVSLNK